MADVLLRQVAALPGLDELRPSGLLIDAAWTQAGLAYSTVHTILIIIHWYTAWLPNLGLNGIIRVTFIPDAFVALAPEIGGLPTDARPRQGVCGEQLSQDRNFIIWMLEAPVKISSSGLCTAGCCCACAASIAPCAGCIVGKLSDDDHSRARGKLVHADTPVTDP